MISIQGQLLEMLKYVAIALGEDLRERLVFVGGCTTALFITDPITIEDVRSTDDVDLIVDLKGFTDWVKLQKELRERRFIAAADETVICRMHLGPPKVDFMPDDPTILGFSNQWYSHGIPLSSCCRNVSINDISNLNRTYISFSEYNCTKINSGLVTV